MQFIQSGSVVDSPLMIAIAQCDNFSAFAASTLVIIPAHNEEECVGAIVRRLRERGFEHIRVVDNASTDRTAETAQAAGAQVVRTGQRGYGMACWAGSEEIPDGIDWLLYCNADASDDFSAYDQFAVLGQEHDLVLGSRTHPEDRKLMTMPQRFGNWLAPALIRLFWRHDFSDLGPQRAIRVEAYRRLAMSDRGFGWTVEMQVRAVEEGLRIAETPVRTFPRTAGRSKISGNLRGSLTAGFIILKTIARLAIQSAFLRSHSRLCLFGFLLLLLAPSESGIAAESLRISGSTTVNPVVSEAAELLRNERGISITIDTAGGSTGGINALGDGRADVAMSSRGLTDSDSEKFPSVNFHPVAIGQDAVSIVVSKEVWDGGVKQLSSDQIRGLYEGIIKNWKIIGGPDLRVVFFNREPGRGEWEVFTKFLFPHQKSATKTSHPTVGSNEETRNKVGSTRGAVTFLSTPWAEGKRVFALDIKNADGTLLSATGCNIASGAYPMSRPLFVITNGEPTGSAKALVDYLLSDPGQELVAKYGYLRLSDLK